MDTFCRTQSAAVGEPIAGSAASNTDVWLALEHDRPWCAKAVLQSELPDAVKLALSAWEDSVPGARVQLIRGDERVRRVGTITFFVGVSALRRASLVRFSLAEVEDLLTIDVPGIVAALRRGDTVPGAQVVERPVVLVCTNGKRDRCCAKWGMPIYNALAAREELECWQTTHLGGHRFAPTLLTLPDGVCYGRLEPADLAPLVAAIEAGKVFELRTLRGRTCLSSAAQAAEAHWRTTHGDRRTASLSAVEEREEGARTVVTLTDDRGVAHEVAMEHRDLGVQARGSCDKEPSHVRGWFAAG